MINAGEQIHLCCIIIQKDHWCICPDKFDEEKLSTTNGNYIIDFGKVTFGFVSLAVK